MSNQKMKKKLFCVKKDFVIQIYVKWFNLETNGGEVEQPKRFTASLMTAVE